MSGDTIHWRHMSKIVRLLLMLNAIFQLYHGESKLIFNEMIMRSALY